MCVFKLLRENLILIVFRSETLEAFEILSVKRQGLKFKCIFSDKCERSVRYRFLKTFDVYLSAIKSSERVTCAIRNSQVHIHFRKGRLHEIFLHLPTVFLAEVGLFD